MSETGFGRYNSINNLRVINTITINGAQHERTNTGVYSNENYGYGYYLVRFYGYSCSKSDNQWKLFYTSSRYPSNSAYVFDVVASNPAQIPTLMFSGNSVVYGYDKAEIVASVNEIVGQTNTYQWYKTTKDKQSSDGERLNGETLNSLQIQGGKDAGDYYYYLEVTTTKESNGDVIKTNYPVKFTVEKAQSNIKITTKSLNKTYNGKAISKPTCDKVGSTNDIIFTWYKKIEDRWEKLDTAPTHAANYKVVAYVEQDTNYTSAKDEMNFEITKATPVVPDLNIFVIKQGEELSSINLPRGFEWKDATIKANELGNQTFTAIYIPVDPFNYKSVEVEIPVNIALALTSVNQAPVIDAKDRTIMIGDSFDPRKDVIAYDKEDGDLTNKIEIINNTVDASKLGTYKVTYKVVDKENVIVIKTINVTVNEKNSSTTNKTNTSVQIEDNVRTIVLITTSFISLMGLLMVIFGRKRSE